MTSVYSITADLDFVATGTFITQSTMELIFEDEQFICVLFK